MFKKWTRKGIGALVLVGILAALVAGTALAQEEPPEGFPGRGRGPHAPVQRLAEATGLTAEEVVAELQGGKTPAEVLTENGADVDAFVDDVLADMGARLDEAVANGVMDQARADEMLAQAAERVPEMLDQTFENLPDRPDGGGKGEHFGRGIFGQLAETVGQTVEDVLAQLKGGKTPAEVLTESGTDPDTFVDDVLADIEARLDEAVADGKIDQEHADQMLEQATERLPEMLNQEFEGPLGPGLGRGKRIGHGIVGQAAEATGLTAEEVVAELQSGKTPAEVLAENGVDVDAFVADVLADMEARLDEAVANGRLDQARADEMLAQAAERLPEMLNKTFEPRGEGDGPPHQDGAFGQGPGGGMPPFGPGVPDESI